MMYRLMADAILVLHLGFLLFVVLGGLLVLRWRWIAWLHMPAAAWGIWIELAGWYCPLTPLEQELRRRSGHGGYSGSFIDHYLAPIIYPEGLTRTAQVVLGVVVLTINLVVYWRVLGSRHRSSRLPGNGRR